MRATVTISIPDDIGDEEYLVSVDYSPAVPETRWEPRAASWWEFLSATGRGRTVKDWEQFHRMVELRHGEISRYTLDQLIDAAVRDWEVSGD